MSETTARDDYIPASIRPRNLEFDSCLEHIGYNIEKLSEILTDEGNVDRFEVLDCIMKGTRPLNNDEIRRVSATFTGMFEVRNRSLFMIGVSTGGHISELLSLRVRDVYQNDKIVSDKPDFIF